MILLVADTANLTASSSPKHSQSRKNWSLSKGFTFSAKRFNFSAEESKFSAKVLIFTAKKAKNMQAHEKEKTIMIRGLEVPKEEYVPPTKVPPLKAFP